MIRSHPPIMRPAFAASLAAGLAIFVAASAMPAGAQANVRATTPTPTPPPAAPNTARPAAPAPAIARTDLQRHDLATPGHEAIQTRVDFAPGAMAPRHRHPGEEIVFILRGTLEYRLDGQAPVTLNPGGTLFIPAGTVHTVHNVGTGVASELATYIVEKGQPLITLVP